MDPLPEWRRTDYQSLRDAKRLRMEQKRQAQQRLDEWGRSDDIQKPVYVNPKDQTVLLPSYTVSITEASNIFREKTKSIRKILRSLEYNVDVDSEEELAIDPDVMELLALELGVKFEVSERQSIVPDAEEVLLQRRAASEETNNREEHTVPYESLPPRPPVVCIMGHVDHGKTTLMDALRRRSQEGDGGGATKKKKSKTKKKATKKGKKGSTGSNDVAGTEAGGITQVISAFQVPLMGSDEAAITFLDTPGHAAFKAMRQSGSDAADVIVLVIAADDGVSPQTIEILNFYKSIVKGAGSGGISLVVALNKIDKPGINVDERQPVIEAELLEQGIVTEGMASAGESEYGPPVQVIPVSGLTGQGLDDLIEGLMLQSEIMDLRADADTGAEGVVMDARVDKGLGVVADCIVRWGSLKKGDIIVSGTSIGKVRILKDMSDKQLKTGVPSQPVRIVGFDTVPKAGDPIIAVESEELAEEIVSRRKAQRSSEKEASDFAGDVELQSSGKHMMHSEWKQALEEKYGLDTDGDEGVIRVPVIVKADADGTLKAVCEALMELGGTSRHHVVIDPVSTGVGPVLANEVQIAKEVNATIVCFNIKNEHAISSLAVDEEVPLIGSDVIYSLLDEAKEEFTRYLPYEEIEVVKGRGVVKAVFDIGGIDEKVAGLEVTEGTLYKDKAKGKDGVLTCQYRVLRKGKEISSSALRATSLKHFKEDVDNIDRGSDCGLSLTRFNEYEEGDVIECFAIEKKREFN